MTKKKIKEKENKHMRWDKMTKKKNKKIEKKTCDGIK